MACSFFLFQNGIASCRISCPGALGACPIGSLQAVIGSPKYQLALYVSGVIILFGALMGHFVCGWLCPFGLLQDAIGVLFTWKLLILLLTALLSVIIYRPFCKYLCPLGAVYALCNPISLKRLHLDQARCISCGKCAAVCKMGVDPVRTPNHMECIRCGQCIDACPRGALSFQSGKSSPLQNK